MAVAVFMCPTLRQMAAAVCIAAALAAALPATCSHPCPLRSCPRFPTLTRAYIRRHSRAICLNLTGCDLPGGIEPGALTADVAPRLQRLILDGTGITKLPPEAIQLVISALDTPLCAAQPTPAAAPHLYCGDNPSTPPPTSLATQPTSTPTSTTTTTTSPAAAPVDHGSFTGLFVGLGVTAVLVLVVVGALVVWHRCSRRDQNLLDPVL